MRSRHHEGLFVAMDDPNPLDAAEPVALARSPTASDNEVLVEAGGNGHVAGGNVAVLGLLIRHTGTRSPPDRELGGENYAPDLRRQQPNRRPSGA